LPAFGVATPLCLMWRALVGGAGATNNGTTIGPATPMGAWWIWPATPPFAVNRELWHGGVMRQPLV